VETWWAVTAKSTTDEIRERFDHDVERFSNLETGQQALPSAAVMMGLVAEAASAVTPHARDVLDVGCGAGNYSLKLLQHVPDLNVTLMDLSRPMLDRAVERVGGATAGRVTALQTDIREAGLGEGQYDTVLAAAVLHHLRDDHEWEAVFTKIFNCLRPGGSFWISDMVQHVRPDLQAVTWRRYGDYLSSLRNESYRDDVFAYIEKEDSPRSLMYQLDLLRRVGFTHVDVLQKDGPSVAFGGVKGR